MRKGLLIIGLSAVIGLSGCSKLFGDKEAITAIQQTIKSMQEKLKSLDDRLSLLIKEVNHIKKVGRFEILPLEQPTLSDDELLKWATTSMVRIYSYNFVNYNEIVNQIKELFTLAGYDSYIKALQDSKMLDGVRDKKLVVSAMLGGPATVLKKGVDDNHVYAWQVKMPLVVNYQSLNLSFQQNVDVALDIVRENTAPYKERVAIRAITAKLASSTEGQELSGPPLKSKS